MQIDDLKKYGLNTPALSLDGICTWARVVDVYDGDTITLVIPFKNDFYKFQCRMRGIDTCEIKSKVKENKDRAIRARNRLLQLAGCTITNLDTTLTRKDIQNMLNQRPSIVWIKCFEFEKFGRLLCDVFQTDLAHTDSFASVLIREKLAYEYMGETKLTEDEQLQTLG